MKGNIWVLKMYILEPVLHETIWGGHKLSRDVRVSVKKIGHLYIVNGHEGMSNKVLNGEHAGKTINDIFKISKGSWKMEEFEEFPLTIALVDACDNLSIQVHPDDFTAERLEKKRIGKTESWLFLEAPSCGWIYDGCNCSSKKQVEDAVAQRRMREITKQLPVSANDCVSLEAGTLHALTSGSLVYEIEYGSDITYRFYDFDRKDAAGNKRELHTEKALESIKLGNKPKVRRNINQGWISEDNYEIRRIENVSEYTNIGAELECVSVLKGSGNYEGQGIGNGTGMILLPGEKIANAALEDIVIARLKR